MKKKQMIQCDDFEKNTAAYPNFSNRLTTNRVKDAKPVTLVAGSESIIGGEVIAALRQDGEEVRTAHSYGLERKTVSVPTLMSGVTNVFVTLSSYFAPTQFAEEIIQAAGNGGGGTPRFLIEL